MKNVQVDGERTRNGENWPTILRLSTADQDTGVPQALDDVFHQPQAAVAVQRQDRFGMKLHGLHRQVAMADAHDDAVVAFGGDFEARREAFPGSRTANDSGRRGTPPAIPRTRRRRDAGPATACRASDNPSTPSSPPNASTMPCNPRHTPNTGISSFAAWRISSGTPKSDGTAGAGRNQNQRRRELARSDRAGSPAR